MANWRSEVKNWFKNEVLSIPEVESFGIWNSHVDKFNQGNKRYPRTPSVLWEYLIISNDPQFSADTSKISNYQQIELQVNLHVLNAVTKEEEDRFDDTSDIVDLIVKKVIGRNPSTYAATPIMMSDEVMDIDFDDMYHFIISLQFRVNYCYEKENITEITPSYEVEAQININNG